MNYKATLTLGTRASPLAVKQGELVKQAIEAYDPHVCIKLKAYETQGDRLKDVPLDAVGGKGLFTQEIEADLLAGRIDLAAHSLKDMAVTQDANLEIGACLEREDPRDCFVSEKYKQIQEVPEGGIIGTASIRRKAVLQNKYPHLCFSLLRGNVQTRLKKMKEKGLSGTILAHAGLLRLGLEHEAREIMDPTWMVPAPGQGIIAVQHHKNRGDLRHFCQAITHTETALAGTAEKEVLRVLGGSCQTPLGAYCEVHSKSVFLRAALAHPSGKAVLVEEGEGTINTALSLASQLGQKLLSRLPMEFSAWLQSEL